MMRLLERAGPRSCVASGLALVVTTLARAAARAAWPDDVALRAGLGSDFGGLGVQLGTSWELGEGFELGPFAGFGSLAEPGLRLAVDRQREPGVGDAVRRVMDRGTRRRRRCAAGVHVARTAAKKKLRAAYLELRERTVRGESAG
jgi:hypothetical protein